MEQEEFADSAVDWLKQLYDRIKDSLKLARIQYGARPKSSNANSHRSNNIQHMNEEGKVVHNNPAKIQKEDKKWNTWLRNIDKEQQYWDQ